MQSSVNINLASGKAGDIFDNSPRRSDPYTLVTSTSAGTAAAGKIVFAANPDANDTISVGSVTYTFKSALAAANDVKIGADLTATLASLVAAINGTGTAGTDYYTGTENLKALVVASAASGTTLNLTAVEVGVAGNFINLASSDANGTVTAFAGGVEPVAALAFVGYWFSILPAAPSTAQAGLVNNATLGGILVNSNQYENWNNLEPTMQMKENSIGDLLSFGRVIVRTAHDVTIGYLGCYNNNTGAIGAASASNTVPDGFTLIPNSRFILTNASANGLAILELGE